MPFNDRAIWLLMSRPTTWFGTAHPLLQSPISFTLIIPETRSRIKNEKKKREKEKSGGRECARRGARWCDNTAALRHTTTMPGAHNLAARSGCINSSWLPALFPHTNTHTQFNHPRNPRCTDAASWYNVKHAWPAGCSRIETSKGFIPRYTRQHWFSRY